MSPRSFWSSKNELDSFKMSIFESQKRNESRSTLYIQRTTLLIYLIVLATSNMKAVTIYSPRFHHMAPMQQQIMLAIFHIHIMLLEMQPDEEVLLPNLSFLLTLMWCRRLECEMIFLILRNEIQSMTTRCMTDLYSLFHVSNFNMALNAQMTKLSSRKRLTKESFDHFTTQ